MKKIWMLVLTVLLVFGLCATVSAAETKAAHTHCLCGGAAEGVGDHTQCEDVTWTSLSQALTAAGLSMTEADFGKLPSGNYYLDGDVTVTKNTYMGSQDGTAPKQVAICLNGHNITSSTSRIFGSLGKYSELTVCDCSWDGTAFSGTVSGGSTSYGSVIYTRAYTVLNVYGGNYIGEGTKEGGTFVVACDDANDENNNGTANEEADRGMASPASVMNLYNGHITGCNTTKTGGAIKAFHNANVNVYGGTVIGASTVNGGAIAGTKGTVRIAGGTVQGGSVTGAGGALFTPSAGSIYITGGKVTGGSVNGVKEEAYILAADGKVVETTTLADALTKVKDSQTQYVRLAQDMESTATVSGAVYLDLAGHSLSGIKVTGTLYTMDSTTDAYDDSQVGKLTYTGSGTVETNVRNPMTAKRYVKIANSDGSFSFHRYYVGITKISLRPDTVGVGYKAVFAGTDTVKEQLAEDNAFGCHLWISPKVVVTQGYGKDQFENKKEISFRVNNFLNESQTVETNQQRAEMELNANVFLRFKDGSEVTSFDTSYSFRQMLEMTSDQFSGYTLAQQTYVQELSKKFSSVMMTWDISAFHHVAGGMWTGINNSSFAAQIKTSGSYVLTEDVNYTGSKITIGAGVDVKICLNGHTLSSTHRLFDNKGKLTICDCHKDGAEGTVTSAHTIENPDDPESTAYAPILYAYAGSQTDLYGGNLNATNLVTSAGVIALSHDMSDTSLPAAVMNMYGGTISGGQSVTGGGLVAIWNGATFNMYDGILENGTTQGSGGAIQSTGTSAINIYGGTIRNNSAQSNGGGIQNMGVLHMSGGLIQNCTAQLNGGGVWNNKQFYLSGGIIEDCTAAGEGGGVRNSSKHMEMSGGTIRNCTALKGGNMLNASLNEFVLSGGVITGGTAEEYPGLCLYNTKAILTGDPQVYGNNGGNLGMEWKFGISARNMDSNARVYVNTPIHTLIGEDTTAVGTIICEDAGYTTRAFNGKSYLWSDQYTVPVEAPSGFSVGFGRVNTNPEMGTALGGYGTQLTRVATQIDTYELYATVVAITDENGETVLLIATDLCNVSENEIVFRQAVGDAVGVPADNIIISASHSHSTPDMSYFSNDLNKEYIYAFSDKLIIAATQAMADRKSATMQVGSFEANGMNFYRHYSYVENGVTKYFGDNFGTLTYNSTTKHVGEADPTMHLVRFVRDGKDILLSNWRAHPHRTGGAEKGLVSSDTVGVLRYYVEKNLDVNFIYMQGAAGNVNTVSRLSSVNHGLTYTAYGEKLATMIQNNLSCLKTYTPGTFQIDNNQYVATLDAPTEEELQAALEVYNYIYGGEHDEEFPTMASRTEYCKKFGYDSIYEVRTTVSRGNRGDGTETLNINTISLGKDLAFFSAPNELWDTVSVEIEESSPFTTTLCFGYANGSNGYLHYQMVDDYKAYEVYNHRYVAPDTILGMIEYWKTALNEQYDNLS